MPLKSGKMLEESKFAMKLSKWKKEKAQFDWKRAEPYLNKEVNLSSRGRQRKSLTLQEFKVLSDADITVKDLEERGYSKHLLRFFSCFLKGKIPVSEDEFEQAYSQGLSLEEISNKFGISRENVTYLRQLYGIKAKGATFIRRKKTEKSLNEKQRQLCIGSLFGDAKIFAPASIGFGHGTSQQDYLMWKWEIMKEHCTKKSLIITPYIDSRSGSNLIDGRFHTKSNTDIEDILKLFYFDGKRIITREALENLDDFALAVWYMDDGTTEWWARKKGNLRPHAMFCTDHCSYAEIKDIRDFLERKFNWNSWINSHGISAEGKIRYRIQLNADSTAELFDRIRPHTIPSMMYKVDKEVYLDKIGK